MTDYTKGDICLVNFNLAKGGEIGKLRPAVIMSNKDELHALSTAIVIPLSTVIEPDTQPYRVFLPKREQLDKDSDICIYEIRSLVILPLLTPPKSRVRPFGPTFVPG